MNNVPKKFDFSINSLYFHRKSIITTKANFILNEIKPMRKMVQRVIKIYARQRHACTIRFVISTIATICEILHCWIREFGGLYETKPTNES